MLGVRFPRFDRLSSIFDLQHSVPDSRLSILGSRFPMPLFRPRLLVAALAFLAMPAAAQPAPADPRAEALVAEYCAAWSTPDAARRERLLEKVWASDGTYTDPTAHVAGRAALGAHIGATLGRAFPPGARFVVASRVDAHHGAFRFAWRVVAADGRVLMEGLDYGEMDDAGRIRRIVGFFGPLAPAAPAAPAARGG
jgi:hypothetical protein